MQARADTFLLGLFAALMVFISLNTMARAEAPSAATYPTLPSDLAAITISEYKRLFPKEEPLVRVASEKIAASLMDKTILATYARYEVEVVSGAKKVSLIEQEQRLSYFSPDGKAYDYVGPNHVREKSWSVADDSLLVFHWKSKDPDGATRVSIRYYPIERLVKWISDSKAGDYCQISGGSTAAIVPDRFGYLASTRIGPACGKRDPRRK